MIEIGDIETSDIMFGAALILILAVSWLGYTDHFGATERTPRSVGDLFSPTDPVTDKSNDTAGSWWFTDTTTEVGLLTNNTSEVTFSGRPEGYGVYASDYNTDGYPDILYLGSNPMLYRNDGGSFTPIDLFEQYTGPAQDLAAAHFFDYDSDGDKDIFIARQDRHALLFTYTGDGWNTTPRELDVTITGSDVRSVASADYNRDGCLDLYIGLKDFVLQRTPTEQERIIEGDIPASRTHEYVDGEENILLKGDCTGAFDQASMGKGVQQAYHTNVVSFVDLNDDGLPDIHAGNDFSQDMIYINEGDGTFEPRRLGPATGRNAMSSVITDFNGDQHPDIFVTNIHAGNLTEDVTQWSVDNIVNSIEGNNVLINDGDGTFTDEAGEYGLEEGGWGWSATVTDLDNDGHQDVLHSTSAGHDLPYYHEHDYDLPRLWNGTGDPEDPFISHPARQAGFHATNGRGLAALDHDMDGLQDVVIGSSPINLIQGTEVEAGKTLTLYTNQLNADDDFLGVQLDYDDSLETGSTVFLHTDSRTRMATINSQADYRSQQSQIAHFGLKDGETIESIEVERPDGTTRRYDDIERGRYHRVNGTHAIPRDH